MTNKLFINKETIRVIDSNTNDILGAAVFGTKFYDFCAATNGKTNCMNHCGPLPPQDSIKCKSAGLDRCFTGDTLCGPSEVKDGCI